MGKEPESQGEGGTGMEIDGEKSDGRRLLAIGKRWSSASKFVFLCAVVASLNSILLGYYVGVISGALLYIKENLKVTEVQEEVLISCLSIVSLIGSIAGGRTSDAIGRKWTIGLSCLIFQTGMAIMALAPSFRELMIGRLTAGLGVGFGLAIAPVYIAEISPSSARGTLTPIPEIFINAGILLGYVSNYIFSDLPPSIGWRVMLRVGILPSVLVAAALLVIPESPRWLVMTGRLKLARSVLMDISGSMVDAERQLAEIEEAAWVHDVAGSGVWRELLSPTPALRRILVTASGIQCFQQITGINAAVYYSPVILSDAGISSKRVLLGATVAVGVTKTAFIMIAIFLVDKLGRKPLLYVSTIGMTTCFFGIGLSLSLLRLNLGYQEIGVALVILALCGNVAFFSIGIGPICWVLTSEIFPLRFRAQGTTVGAIGNRISSGLVTMSFLSVSRVISVGGTFFAFSASSVASVVFVHVFVPETKGKSLEQLDALFQKEGDGMEVVNWSLRTQGIWWEMNLNDLRYIP